MIEELKKIILDYQEINRLLDNILILRKITFDQQVEISNHFDKYSDSNQISIVLLNNINETKFLKVLYAEVDQLVKSYNENKIFLDGLNIKELYYEYSGFYDNLIEQKKISINPIANKFHEMKNNYNATAYGSHKLEEIEKRKIEYYQAKEIYYDEKKELDELYDEKKEREEYSLQFLKNRFNDIFEINQSLKTELSKYCQSNYDRNDFYFEMSLCGDVYKIVNDNIFYDLDPIVFYESLNLLNSGFFKIKNENRLKVYYLIRKLNNSIEDTEKKKVWLEKMLENLEIKKSTYHSKSKINNETSSDTLMNFKKEIDKVFSKK